ncbi:beta-1,4-N-acetylgalactosaminyltransferase bre-4-like [Gigantopelta aegis]|uniref:beta-1,4-N-acetylgalactosaminyltransferase bre-4-like n=1 Tax=Gigantopelta aegis TaxID=1735272 RepID=UPI001B88814D|nr:beta-1,4-N-acetylgalactosaminyltransferase bre-4-like [Gigantopelta aegis]
MKYCDCNFVDLIQKYTMKYCDCNFVDLIQKYAFKYCDYNFVDLIPESGNGTFNKGRIMNAAFKEALKLYDFQCIVFHDVDLVPEDDRNMYTCPWQPRHMSVAIDEHDYRLKYDILVGGVLNMRTEHYQRVNGYSNMYWGWGAEDDDMAYRILHVGLKISRPPSNLARYKMIKHQKRRPAAWITRSKLLHTAVKRYKLDGLNSVKYRLIFIHDETLFTHIMVDVGKP